MSAVHGVLFTVRCSAGQTVAKHEVYPDRRNFKFGYGMARTHAIAAGGGTIAIERSPETNYERK